jgi:hypothetical protein
MVINRGNLLEARLRRRCPSYARSLGQFQAIFFVASETFAGASRSRAAMSVRYIAFDTIMRGNRDRMTLLGAADTPDMAVKSRSWCVA